MSTSQKFEGLYKTEECKLKEVEINLSLILFVWNGQRRKWWTSQDSQGNAYKLEEGSTPKGQDFDCSQVSVSLRILKTAKDFYIKLF